MLPLELPLPLCDELANSNLLPPLRYFVTNKGYNKGEANITIFLFLIQKLMNFFSGFKKDFTVPPSKYLVLLNYKR